MLCLVVALLWPSLRERRHRAAVIGVATVVAIVVGATRAYRGVHWPSDVRGGWSLGRLLLTLAVTGLSFVRFHSLPTPEYRRRHRRATEHEPTPKP